jgi:HSP20 family protein
MAITRWRPFRDLVSIRDEMNRLFEDFFGGTPARSEWEEGIWSPTIDVSETKDKVMVEADLPGLKKEDVKISVQDDTLIIKGEKKQKKEEKEADYHRVERSYGSFFRLIPLPTSVKRDQVKANYKDGVLKITMPKTEEVKSKEIPISIE